MTATVHPSLPPLGSAALGLSLGGNNSGNQCDNTPLPSLEALFGPHTRIPVARACSADDVHGTRSRKASPALAHFAADWGRLTREHPRFADGVTILQKIDPRSKDNRTIEVRPQAPRSPVGGDYGLVRKELANLATSKSVCNVDVPTHEVPDSLARGSPLVVGLPSPRQDALGSIAPPIRLPGTVHGSALMLGAGAIARTSTPLQTPVLTRQVAGRTLIVYWVPVAQALHARIPAGASFGSTMHRLMNGATLRAVVLGAGEWCILPAGAVYVTLALGDRPDQQIGQELHSSFAVQVKFAVHLPNAAAPAKSPRAGEKRKAEEFDNDSASQTSGSYTDSVPDSDDDCYECRAVREIHGRTIKRARTEEYDEYNYQYPRVHAHDHTHDHHDHAARTGRSVSPRAHDFHHHARDRRQFHASPSPSRSLNRHASPTFSAYTNNRNNNNKDSMYF